jgi:hypothetical protein
MSEIDTSRDEASGALRPRYRRLIGHGGDL